MDEQTSALTGIVIRQAAEDDLPHLLCEANAVYLRFMFQSAFDSMRRGEQLLWVAEHATDGIIGQLIVQFNSMRAQLADGTSLFLFFPGASPMARTGCRLSYAATYGRKPAPARIPSADIDRGKK